MALAVIILCRGSCSFQAAILGWEITNILKPNTFGLLMTFNMRFHTIGCTFRVMDLPPLIPIQGWGAKLQLCQKVLQITLNYTCAKSCKPTLSRSKIKFWREGRHPVYHSTLLTLFVVTTLKQVMITTKLIAPKCRIYKVL